MEAAREETEQRRRGRVGGLSSWVLSGSHHVPPRRPVSSCGPRAQGRKLDIGASTAGMLWEHCVCVRVCMTVCVSECECLCGKSLPHRRPTIIPCGSPFLEHPPTYPFNNPLPHPLCPLARHVLHKRTRKTYARTGTSTHMDSIKHEMHGSL